ncbi:MAG: isopentenyl phosphate kinase family protein [Caldilineaceae bacterium]|nr:isopentenyl phosphate kinase family protein [Caldilineaceae bacterium]
MQTVFLKLGGSLITDKRIAERPRLDVIGRLAHEIAGTLRQAPGMRLVIGHGSGSFGHVYGRKYGTRAGVRSPDQWYGFAATADAAARLNRIVVAELLASGVPAWSIQPGVALRCADGHVVAGPEDTVSQALERGLTPVVFGDVALDSVRGGTIASTEEIFAQLATFLQPQRIILAGEVDGIFTADPIIEPDAKRIDVITPETLAAVAAGLGSSHGVDVTGGMVTKVSQALAMVERQPELELVICSGLVEGAVQQALLGAAVGTRVAVSAS